MPHEPAGDFQFQQASCTAAALSPLWRISSSTATGAVVSRPAMSAGSASASSSAAAAKPAARPRGTSSAGCRRSRTAARSRRRASAPAPRHRGSAGCSRARATSSGRAGHRHDFAPAFAGERAVISEPDLGAASTTSVPAASPAMMRLRDGKWRASGSVPGGCSAISRPCSATCSCRSACSGG